MVASKHFQNRKCFQNGGKKLGGKKLGGKSLGGKKLGGKKLGGKNVWWEKFIYIYIYIYIYQSGRRGGAWDLEYMRYGDIPQGVPCGKNSEKFGVHEIFCQFFTYLELFVFLFNF